MAEPLAGGSTRVWQRMLSGRRLDLLRPVADDIDIADIARGLARVARWNGQTLGAHVFSVAQHSLLVETIASAWEPSLAPGERLRALLHDAPEYVIGDLISPFKAVVGDGYKAVEASVFKAVERRFGLPPPSPSFVALIKRADRAAAFLEATRLAGFTLEEARQVFGCPDRPLPDLRGSLRPVRPVQAEALFLARFGDLDADAPPGPGHPRR